MGEITDNNRSLLILKPETGSLTAEALRILDDTVTNHVLPMCSQVFEMLLDSEQVAAMWGHIGHFPWADEYFRHMSSEAVRVFVLQGENTALELKLHIRNVCQGMIADLQETLGVGFSPDIVHGSDPGDFNTEARILQLGLDNESIENQF
jgi:hypothetical protein